MANESEFGDFEEIKDESKQETTTHTEAPQRVRLPRNKELIGIIVQRYGGNRMEILTTDGKSRNCRVPGRYKRRLWLRPKDIVLIIPWEDDDSKGDIVFKYQKPAVNQLKKRNLLKDLKSDF